MASSDPSPLSGRAQRMEPAQRRDEIIQAALRVIARSGFAGTTLRDVATECGVAHGLLRHHFGTREALLAAAFDSAATAEIAELDAAPDDAMAAAIDALSPPSAEHYLLWIDAWSEAPRNADLARTLVHHHQACDDHLRQAIATGVARGVFVCADIDAAVTGLVALQDGLAVQEFALGILTSHQASALMWVYAERVLGCPKGSFANAAQGV